MNVSGIMAKRKRCNGDGTIQCEKCYGSYVDGRREMESENILDVFLSYSSVDRQEANEIYEAIKNAGGRVFISEKDLNPGEDFAEEVRNAISSSRELWLLVSPNSIKSDWVISEWGAAWVLRKKIVPILHSCRPEDLPDRIRRLQCIDFYKYLDLVRNRFQKEDSGGAS
jgi:hypothetical protein